MPSVSQRPQTEGSKTFDPDRFFDAWREEQLTPPCDNDFRKFIVKAFGLPLEDDYVYVATAKVSLLQAQTYLERGGQGGLHAWYRDPQGQAKPPPPAADIAAYTDVFRPTTSTAKALTALAANAKKDSIRRDVAEHLNRHFSPPPPHRNLVTPRHKAHPNPYLDVWAWSNQALEWAGPDAETVRTRFSHALLPVLYHHFGCVCPSWEALWLVRQVARGKRRILDVGSGNGYWTYMLRRMEGSSGGGGGSDGSGGHKKKKNNREEVELEVVPIDSALSEWRTVWVGDTIYTDGVEWLQQNEGGREDVLMLIYPSVGHDFTSRVVRAYRGSTIVCAGTQNASGFTAFAGETIAQWMSREMPEWTRLCQVPLPSFAGKDEALFIFERERG